MKNEFDKCYFCKSYDDYEGWEWGCNNKEGFSPDHNRIIKKAKEKNISVQDVIALINLLVTDMSKNKDLLDLLEWIVILCNLCEENLEKEKVFLAVAERECIEDDEQFIIEKAKKRIIKWDNRLDAYQAVENHIEEPIWKDRKRWTLLY